MGNLFEQKYPNNIRTISGLVNVPFQDDSILECNTSLGAVAIQLLDIPTNFSTQYKLYITDKSGNASVNNITVTAPVGYLINGAPSFVINSNKASLLVRVSSPTNYVGQYSVISGGGGGGYSIVQDEGVALPSRNTMDFQGAGVTVTDNGVKTIVTITGGGGGGIIDISNANLLALITAGTVVVGQFYRVTDPQYADLGVIVQGVRTDGVSDYGAGVFLNADYQMLGNYSGVAGFVSAKGLWSATAIPIVAGDCVVYGNLHYKNLTGVWGTAPDGDAVNWVVLPKLTTNGYILNVDFVRYNIPSNLVIYRADNRGNEVDYSSTADGISFLLFQWGKNNVLGNKMRGESTMICTNSFATFKGNILDNGRIFDNTDRVESGRINFNTIDCFGTLNLVNTKGTVEQNYISGLGSNFTIYGGGSPPLLDVSCVVRNNRITANSQITIGVMNGGGSVTNTEVTRNSHIDVQIIQGLIANCFLSNNGVLNVNNGTGFFSIGAGAGYQGCEVSDKQTVNMANETTLYQFKKIKSGYSNWEITLTIAEFLAGVLTIPVGKDFGGIFTTVGLDAVVVNKIFGLSDNHISTFKAVGGGLLNLSHTAIGVAIAGDLICDASPVTNVLVGRVGGGSDFNQYLPSGNLVQRTNVVINA